MLSSMKSQPLSFIAKGCLSVVSLTGAPHGRLLFDAVFLPARLFTNRASAYSLAAVTAALSLSSTAAMMTIFAILDLAAVAAKPNGLELPFDICSSFSKSLLTDSSVTGASGRN